MVKHRFLLPIRFQQYPWAIYIPVKYKDDKPGGLLKCGVCLKAKELRFSAFEQSITSYAGLQK